MTSLLSPFSRRIIALAILFLMAITATNVVFVPMYEAVGAALDNLAEARFQNARLVAIKARPALRRGLPVSPALIFTGSKRDEASQSFSKLIDVNAERHNIETVTVTPTPLDPKIPMSISLDISATAPEADLAAFINSIEQGEPAIRFTSWRLSTVPGSNGLTRLEARATALWSQ